MNKKLQRIPVYFTALLILIFNSFGIQLNAQGFWTTLSHNAPDSAGGVMLLLSDGTVISKTFAGGNDLNGNIWDKLTPDINGSYINGTWTQIAAMHNTRTYFSSQVLMDGRIYVAGGEYGTGGQKGETYDPVTDIWTMTPNSGHTYSDANSEILPDGRVLESLVEGNVQGTILYDPKLNTYSPGPQCLGIHNESAWVKLPDSSILFVNLNSTNSERYIPALDQWIADSNVPVSLYDPYGEETGPGFLLPDGRCFFLGSTGHTAYYTPSGNNNPGTWAAGPDIPNSQGTPDAAAAMMVNGKILCAVSPAPTSSTNIFDPPTAFYEFDYVSNSFTQTNSPEGSLTINEPCYVTNMLQLPDGNILYSQQDSVRYFVYTPSGPPLAAGKPTIGNISNTNCDTFRITGTLFNGISEGAAYGDDWQMATNYPVIRLTSGSNVYYAKTFYWNRTSVMTGNLGDTTYFTLPVGLPPGTYQLVVTANGNPSASVSFTPCFPLGIENNSEKNNLSVYPDPAKDKFNVELPNENFDLVLSDVTGRKISEIRNVFERTSVDCSFLQNGIYFIRAITDKQLVYNKKIIIAK